jgi:uncharacterized protein YndB with AHSA1/START domain
VTDATTESPPLTIEKLIPAPPARVFAAWLDPTVLAKFMCPMPGTSVAKAETDPRVGGRFLILMRIGGQDRPHQGEYRVVEPHKRLVFTWHSQAAPPESEVTLTFAEAGADQTLLTLVHRGLPTAVRAAHDHGWTSIVAMLAQIARD